MKALVALCLSMSVAACTADRAVSSIFGLTRLNNDEINSLIRGRRMRLNTEPGLVQGSQTYGLAHDGTLHVTWGRGASTGRYEVRGNQLCLRVAPTAEEHCQFVVRDSAGNIFLVYPSRPEAPPRSVSIE